MQARFFSFILLFGFIYLFSSCDEPVNCPDGNFCTIGNTYEFQSNLNGAKLIIEVPEGAVYNNAAVVTTDLIPAYPAQVSYDTPKRYFAGGLFKIEPTDLALKGLIKLTIQFPPGANFDRLGNNYSDDLRLYYVVKDNWSIVNESVVNLSSRQVSANVLRLGTYAVGAPRLPIVADWQLESELYDWGYSKRLVFLHNSSGYWEEVYDCNVLPEVLDYQLSYEEFEWELLNDSVVNLFDFTPRQVCDTIGFTRADMITTSIQLSDNYLVFPGMGELRRIK